MAEKLKHRKHDRGTAKAAVDAQQTISNAAQTAQRNLNEAMRTGQKLQEEASQWWTRMCSQRNLGEWQKQVTQMARIGADVLPLTQRRMEEMMSWMDRSGRTGAELMRKAVEAAQTGSLAESQNKWMEVWASSMKALQSNVDSATEFSNRTLDAWITFIRRNSEIEEIRPSKAA